MKAVKYALHKLPDFAGLHPGIIVGFFNPFPVGRGIDDIRSNCIYR
jgi:hypothetical protein